MINYQCNGLAWYCDRLTDLAGCWLLTVVRWTLDRSRYARLSHTGGDRETPNITVVAASLHHWMRWAGWTPPPPELSRWLPTAINYTIMLLFLFKKSRIMHIMTHLERL